MNLPTSAIAVYAIGAAAIIAYLVYVIPRELKTRRLLKRMEAPAPPAPADCQVQLTQPFGGGRLFARAGAHLRHRCPYCQLPFNEGEELRHHLAECCERPAIHPAAACCASCRLIISDELLYLASHFLVQANLREVAGQMDAKQALENAACLLIRSEAEIRNPAAEPAIEARRR